MTALSYQLYSSRLFPPLTDTLRMLSDIGYAHVEGYSALLSNPDDVAALEQGLKETGLTMPSCHVGLEMCEGSPSDVAALAERFGVETIVVPYIMPDDRPTDVAGWQALGARLQAVAEALGKHELSLGTGCGL
jgi:sugar phosphate isomerase/epimerase